MATGVSVTPGAAATVAMAIARDPWYEVLAPYLVALVSLTGVFTSLWWNRAGSHRAWLRDHRLESCSSLIGQCHDIELVAIRTWVAQDGEPRRHDLMVDLQERLHRLGITTRRLELLGPERLGKGAFALLEAMGVVSDRVLDATEEERQSTSVVAGAEWEAASQQQASFMAIARLEIQ